MNFKKLITFIVTSTFIFSLVPVATVHAEEQEELIEHEEQIKQNTTDKNNQEAKQENQDKKSEEANFQVDKASIYIEETQLSEVKISDDFTINQEEASIFKYDSDEADEKLVYTKDIISLASNDYLRERALSIIDEYSVPDICPSDLCISYTVYTDGSISDVSVEYTKTDEDEDENEELIEEEILTNKVDDKLNDVESEDSKLDKAEETNDSLSTSKKTNDTSTSSESEKTTAGCNPENSQGSKQTTSLDNNQEPSEEPNNSDESNESTSNSSETDTPAQDLETNETNS
ncbi:MAG: hypothetical protein K5883_04920 [Pseudobutyrivibrio sp.]|nr:hypothetical protein [Pseudobutyrivibrio sp.]